MKQYSDERIQSKFQEIDRFLDKVSRTIIDIEIRIGEIEDERQNELQTINRLYELGYKENI